MATLIDLIRHGEPEGGRAYRGHGVDDPLSDKGWWQMSSAVEHYCPWSHIISSPMQRCLAFAQELAGRHELPLTIEERFKEVGFGLWEGKSPDEVIALWPDAYEAFYQDPVHSRPQGAEPLQGFYDRVGAALAEVAETHRENHVLIVAHAGVIRAALAYALAAPAGSLYRFNIPNAGVSRLSLGRRGWQVESVNAKLTG